MYFRPGMQGCWNVSRRVKVVRPAMEMYPITANRMGLSDMSISFNEPKQFTLKYVCTILGQAINLFVFGPIMLIIRRFNWHVPLLTLWQGETATRHETSAQKGSRRYIYLGGLYTSSCLFTYCTVLHRSLRLNTADFLRQLVSQFPSFVFPFAYEGDNNLPSSGDLSNAYLGSLKFSNVAESCYVLIRESLRFAISCFFFPSLSVIDLSRVVETLTDNGHHIKATLRRYSGSIGPI